MKYVGPVGVPVPTGTRPKNMYKDENLAAGIEGSCVPAEPFDSLQTEIENVIKAAGLTPSSDDYTQLKQAITKLMPDLSALALKARKLNTTAPLTGGGDLTADRTIGISAATETATGAVALASLLETVAGIIGTKAVHPAGLKSALGYYVPTARKITTSYPLAGGGALTGDCTITINTASESVKGAVALATAAETVTGTLATKAIHPAGLASALGYYVPETRKINTQVPLTGGGVLSGDLTLGVSSAAAATATANGTVGGWVKLAADNAAETVRNMAATPAGVAAQITKAPAVLRAWAFVNANGSIARSYNVAGIVKKSAGRYEITLAAAAPDTSYLIFPIPMGDSEMAWLDRGIAITTTKFQLVTANSTGLAFDARFAFNIVY